MTPRKVRNSGFSLATFIAVKCEQRGSCAAGLLCLSCQNSMSFRTLALQTRCIAANFLGAPSKLGLAQPQRFHIRAAVRDVAHAFLGHMRAPVGLHSWLFPLLHRRRCCSKNGAVVVGSPAVRDVVDRAWRDPLAPFWLALEHWPTIEPTWTRTVLHQPLGRNGANRVDHCWGPQTSDLEDGSRPKPNPQIPYPHTHTQKHML